LGSGSVSWRSTRSSSVLGSSCEAEIYAGAMAAQELRWLTYLLTDLGEQPRSPPVLYVDNKAMLALCREHRLEHRTKHIALRYFLARELQQRGQLRLAYVASEANTTDIFTKALPPGDHQRFCILRGRRHGTFDDRGVARPYTKEDFLKVYPHWRDPTKKLTVAQEEELACLEAEELRRKSIAEARGTFACATLGEAEEEIASNEGGWGSAGGWGTSNTGGTWADAGSGWGAASGGEGSGWGTSGGSWGMSQEEQRGGAEGETEPPVVPLGRPPRLPTPALPPLDLQPHRNPWDTID
ncbi:unnamed protein product, partial [Closterium sp. NIES-53]